MSFVESLSSFKLALNNGEMWRVLSLLSALLRGSNSFISNFSCCFSLFCESVRIGVYRLNICFSDILWYPSTHLDSYLLKDFLMSTKHVGRFGIGTVIMGRSTRNLYFGLSNYLCFSSGAACRLATF